MYFSHSMRKQPEILARSHSAPFPAGAFNICGVETNSGSDLTTKSRNPIKRNKTKKEQGYILLSMLLFVALLSIGATVAIARIDTQVKRDREEEMVHRGVQYSRAIRNFVKKFGRYPTSIEDLQETNNLRFLRKRYKDPITGKDFKLLHMGDIQSITTPSLNGATPAGAMAGTTGQQGFGQSSPQAGFMQSGAAGGFGAGNSAAGNSANGNSGQLALSGDLAGNGNQGNAQSPGSQNTQKSADQNSGDSSSSGTWNEKGSPGEFQPGQTNGQVFGGGPIVGVASLSKAKSIRMFNKKDHYNEWFFIYDPMTDRGGLINTPYQPGVGGTIMPGQMGMPGQTGMPGAPATTAAPNPGFGAPGSPNSGFGNTGVSPQQPQQNPTMQNPAPF